MKKLLFSILFLFILQYTFGQSITISPTTPVASCKSNTINVDFTTSGAVNGPYTIKIRKEVIGTSGFPSCPYTVTSFPVSISTSSLTGSLNLNSSQIVATGCVIQSRFCSTVGIQTNYTDCTKYYIIVSSANGINSAEKEIEITDCSSLTKIKNIQILGSVTGSCQNKIIVGFSNLGLINANAYPITIDLRRSNGSIGITSIADNAATSAELLIPNSSLTGNDYFIRITSLENYINLSTPKNISINNTNLLTSTTGCIGDEFTVNSNFTDINNTYTWLKDGIDVSNSNISDVPYILKKNNSSANDIGVYTLLVRNGLCERTTDPLTVNFTPINLPPTANNVINVSGNTATLTASGCSSAANTHWYDGNTYLTNGTSFTSPPLTQAKVYGVLCNGTCPSEKTLVTVSINSTGAPAAPSLSSSGSPVCAGGVITLSAICSGGIVKWYTSAATTQEIATGNTFLPATPNNKTSAIFYYADCRVNNITSVSRSSISFTTTDVFAPTVPNVTINSGSTITLTASCGLGTTKWYDTNTGTVPLGTNTSYTTPALTTSQDYFVSCTAAASTCTSTRTQVIVTVNTAITAPNLDASVDNICGSGTSVLTASGCSNGTIRWYSTATGTTILATGISYTTPTLSNVGTNTYYASCTIGVNVSSRRSIPVKVFAAATMPTITGTITINEGESTTLTASCQPSQFIKWYESSTVISTNAAFITPILSANRTYSAVCGSNDGVNDICVSSQRNVTITVTPVCEVPISYNTTLNSGSAITLSASNCDNGTLKWYTLSGTTYTLIVSASSYTTPTLTSTTSYYVSCTKSGCESAKKQVIVEINCNTIPTPTATTVTVPNGSSASLTASGCPGNVVWRSVIGGTVLFQGANNVPFNTPPLTQNPSVYYVSCANGVCGNYANSNVLVTVNLSCVPPTAPSADGGQFAENVQGLLTASGCNGNYKWYGSATGTTFLQNSTSNTYTTSLLIAGNTTYYVSCFEQCESTRTPINLTILPTLKTNNTWLASETNQNGWKLAGFNDDDRNSWAFALDNGSSCYSSGGKQIWYSQNFTNIIYFRKKFYVPFIPQPSTFRIMVNSDIDLYVNGALAFSNSSCSNYNNSNNYIDITNYLQQGENVIAIQGTKCGINGNGFFCLTSNIPITNCNVNINPNITSNSPISSGSSAIMTASGCTGTYRWYNQASGGSFTVGSTYTVDILTVSTTYYVSCFSTAGNCESPRVAKNIIVGAGNGNNCNQALVLVSSIDDYSSGTYLKKTNETINASNKVTNTAQTTYRSNKSITLEAGTVVNPGFKAQPATGGYFKAEIGGCN